MTFKVLSHLIETKAQRGAGTCQGDHPSLKDQIHNKIFHGWVSAQRNNMTLKLGARLIEEIIHSHVNLPLNSI